MIGIKSYICETENDFVECQTNLFKQGYEWPGEKQEIRYINTLINILELEELPLVIHIHNNFILQYDFYSSIYDGDYNFVKFSNRKNKLKTILGK